MQYIRGKKELKQHFPWPFSKCYSPPTASAKVAGDVSSGRRRRLAATSVADENNAYRAYVAVPGIISRHRCRRAANNSEWRRRLPTNRSCFPRLAAELFVLFVCFPPRKQQLPGPTGGASSMSKSQGATNGNEWLNVSSFACGEHGLSIWEGGIVSDSVSCFSYMLLEGKRGESVVFLACCVTPLWPCLP